MQLMERRPWSVKRSLPQIGGIQSLRPARVSVSELGWRSQVKGYRQVGHTDATGLWFDAVLDDFCLGLECVEALWQKKNVEGALQVDWSVSAVTWMPVWIVIGAAAALVAGGFIAASTLRIRLSKRIRELEGRLEQNSSELTTWHLETRRLELELATATQHVKKLKRLVTVDPLTGIANRRHLDRTLEREIRRARRERSPLSVIFCDIDGFKLYNDKHGHARGDEVLAQVAKTLDETFRRGSDLAARYGGEEFVVVLPGVDAAQASLYAERLRRRIWRLEIPYVGGPVADRLTVSAGVATLTPEELAGDPALLPRAPEVLLNSADAALYRAKCLGRNRVAVKGDSGPAIVAVEMAS